MDKSKYVGAMIRLLSRNLVVLGSALLVACGGGGGGSGATTATNVEPPASSAKLPSLISTVEGVEVDATDALGSVPAGYKASDVTFGLSVNSGSDAEITALQTGKWLVKPKVTALAEFSLKLDIHLAGHTRSQVIQSYAYPDVDAARQVLSFGAAKVESAVAVGSILTLPVQIKQVKTTSSPGVAAQVFFSGNVWEWDSANLVVPDDKLVTGVVYQDISDLDNDAATTHFVLCSWLNASPEGWGVKHDAKWYELVSLKFTRKTDAASVFRLGVKDQPVNQAVVTVPASIGVAP